MKSQNLKIILLTLLFAAILYGAIMDASDLDAYPVARKRKGEITVYNGTDRDLYITIAGRNQGTVGANQSETYTVKFGNHRVEATWEGGSTHTYISISRSNPSDSWHIKQNDISESNFLKKNLAFE